MGAGHETTVTTLGWIFFELATHPNEQRQLRDEIYSVRAADHADESRPINLDALPFLNAVIKVNLPHVYYLIDGWKCGSDFQETLRFDTTIPHLFRVTTRDEVIPLSEQVLCQSGGVIKELCVPQGTHIIISAVAYHR